MGSPEILERLSATAPITAVRGNIDKPAWARKLPGTEVLELAGVSIYILHDLDLLDIDPASAGFAMVVSGHSHQPKIGRKRGVHYVNPGSIGPRRFRLPVSFAKVACEGPEFVIELVSLEEIPR